jgi:uncharacterized protein
LYFYSGPFQNAFVMLIKVEFAAFGIDQDKNSPLVFLREIGGTRMMPVPVAALEVSAIAIETLKVTTQKPLTIDVAKCILEQFGGTLRRVIFSLGADAFLTARLEIDGPERPCFIECRPCDALALAFRVKAPLYVNEEAFLKYTRAGDAAEGESMRNHIASLDTLEFGTYHLE